MDGEAQIEAVDQGRVESQTQVERIVGGLFNIFAGHGSVREFRPHSLGFKAPKDPLSHLAGQEMTNLDVQNSGRGQIIAGEKPSG